VQSLRRTLRSIALIDDTDVIERILLSFFLSFILTKDVAAIGVKEMASLLVEIRGRLAPPFAG
jgi:hypothetical protein